MASAPNVLRVNRCEEQAAYRTAISRIILNIQNAHGVTLVEIAERIDISVGTISNAANKETDLNAVYLKRLGEAYGPEILDPYAALIGGRFVPIDAQDVDAMPPLTAAIHQIALARSIGSPGGQIMTHSELLGMMPALRAAQQAISHLIAKSERIAA